MLRSAGTVIVCNGLKGTRTLTSAVTIGSSSSSTPSVFVLGLLEKGYRAATSMFSSINVAKGKPDARETAFWTQIVTMPSSHLENQRSNIETVAREAVAGVNNNSDINHEDVYTHILQSSTVKKRKMAMNKHKLKKRRKLLKMNTKVSRGATR